MRYRASLPMLLALWLLCSCGGNASGHRDSGADGDAGDAGPLPAVDYDVALHERTAEAPLSRALLGHYDLSGALFGYDSVPGLAAAMGEAGFAEWRVSVGRWEAFTLMLPTLTDGTPCPFPLPEAFAPPSSTDLDLLAARDWFTDDGSPVSLADTANDDRYALGYAREVLDVVEALGARPFLSLDLMPRALAAEREPRRATEDLAEACQWSFSNRVSNGPPADPQVYAAAAAGLVRRLVEGSHGAPGRALAHVEIGNEPDVCPFWDPLPGNDVPCGAEPLSERMAAFFDMAVPALLGLRDYRSGAAHPGAASLRFGLGSFARADLAVVALEQLSAAPMEIPLDFVSFHAYDTDPRGILEAIRRVADARAGSTRYPDVELVLAEWGPSLAAAIDPAGMDQPLLMATVIVLGAAAGLDRAHHSIFWDFFPDGAITWGLVDHEGAPRPLHRAYQLLARAIPAGAVRLVPEGTPEGHLAPGAAAPADVNALLLTRDPGGSLRALLVCHGDVPRTFRLRRDGVPLVPAAVESLSGTADAIQTGTAAGSDVTLTPRSLTLVTY